MAKRKKVLPARKQEPDRSRDDESLLMRSAETLGRMIGTLQRQLDGATKRLTKTAEGITSKRKTKQTSKKSKAASTRKTAGARTSGGARKRTATRSAKKR